MFDATAPLERQRAQSGRKVLAMTHTHLDVSYPIMVMIEGFTGAYSVDESGTYCGSQNHHCNIVTLPEVKPCLETFTNVRLDGSLGPGYYSLKAASHFHSLSTHTLRLTFDPNTNKVSSSIAWEKD